jgi:hypothetical protein
MSLALGDVPHQVCNFHILKELTKAILHAVACLRKQLIAKAPKLPCCRPRATSATRRQPRYAQRLRQRVGCGNNLLVVEGSLFGPHGPVTNLYGQFWWS